MVNNDLLTSVLALSVWKVDLKMPELLNGMTRTTIGW